MDARRQTGDFALHRPPGIPPENLAPLLDPLFEGVFHARHEVVGVDRDVALELEEGLFGRRRGFGVGFEAFRPAPRVVVDFSLDSGLRREGGRAHSVVIWPVMYRSTNFPTSPSPVAPVLCPASFKVFLTAPTICPQHSSASCCEYPPPSLLLSANCGANLLRASRNAKGGKDSWVLPREEYKSRREEVSEEAEALLVCRRVLEEEEEGGGRKALREDWSSGIARRTWTVLFM